MPSKIKLIKIASEINVAKDTIVDYLNAKGFEIENKVSAVLTEEMADVVLTRFQKEKIKAEKQREKIQKTKGKKSSEEHAVDLEESEGSAGVVISEEAKNKSKGKNNSTKNVATVENAPLFKEEKSEGKKNEKITVEKIETKIETVEKSEEKIEDKKKKSKVTDIKDLKNIVDMTVKVGDVIYLDEKSYKKPPAKRKAEAEAKKELEKAKKKKDEKEKTISKSKSKTNTKITDTKIKKTKDEKSTSKSKTKKEEKISEEAKIKLIAEKEKAKSDAKKIDARKEKLKEKLAEATRKLEEITQEQEEKLLPVAIKFKSSSSVSDSFNDVDTVEVKETKSKKSKTFSEDSVSDVDTVETKEAKSKKSKTKTVNDDEIDTMEIRETKSKKTKEEELQFEFEEHKRIDRLKKDKYKEKFPPKKYLEAETKEDIPTEEKEETANVEKELTADGKGQKKSPNKKRKDKERKKREEEYQELEKLKIEDPEKYEEKISEKRKKREEEFEEREKKRAEELEKLKIENPEKYEEKKAERKKKKEEYEERQRKRAEELEKLKIEDPEKYEERQAERRKKKEEEFEEKKKKRASKEKDTATVKEKAKEGERTPKKYKTKKPPVEFIEADDVKVDSTNTIQLSQDTKEITVLGKIEVLKKQDGPDFYQRLIAEKEAEKKKKEKEKERERKDRILRSRRGNSERFGDRKDGQSDRRDDRGRDNRRDDRGRDDRGFRRDGKPFERGDRQDDRRDDRKRDGRPFEQRGDRPFDRDRQGTTRASTYHSHRKYPRDGEAGKEGEFRDRPPRDGEFRDRQDRPRDGNFRDRPPREGENRDRPYRTDRQGTDRPYERRDGDRPAPRRDGRPFEPRSDRPYDRDKQGTASKAPEKKVYTNNAPPKGSKRPILSYEEKKQRRKMVRESITSEDIDRAIRATLAGMEDAGSGAKKAKIKQKKKEVREEKEARHLERIARESKILRLTEFVTTSDLAAMVNIKASEIITKCMRLGLMVTINQRLDKDTIQIIADDYGFNVEFVEEREFEDIAEEVDAEDSLLPRPPIVTIMGHVDHGKTSLLDHIRNANIVAGEAGGITQHIGAYRVILKNKKAITFLDTPGHEAFTAMRARGAQVTDIVVIVVAADDSVMPQTIEAISHAKAANVPIVVAINKIDKAEANVDRIKQQLSEHGILVEDWGGTHQCAEISAKKGTNVNVLLDKILVEAEMLDLKANPNRNASGVVIESKMMRGLGNVASVIIQRGTLFIGDTFVAGANYGKTRVLLDERENRVEDVLPSQPVVVVGIDGLPEAGDTFTVVNSETEAREIATRRRQLRREQDLRKVRHTTLDDISEQISLGGVKDLRLILKGDVAGSVEALGDSLLKLSTQEVRVNIIHKGAGTITESDVMLATASSAIIIGFNISSTPQAAKLAEMEKVEIRNYNIIYDCMNDIHLALEGMLRPDIKEEIAATIEVRQTFKISKVGQIAGCYVSSGKVNRNDKVRVLRDGFSIFTGTIASLRRNKDDVRDVDANYECGIQVASFNSFEIGDIIEAVRFVEVKRTLER